MITKTNRPIVTRGHLNLRYLHLEDGKDLWTNKLNNANLH